MLTSQEDSLLTPEERREYWTADFLGRAKLEPELRLKIAPRAANRGIELKNPAGTGGAIPTYGYARTIGGLIATFGWLGFTFGVGWLVWGFLTVTALAAEASRAGRVFNSGAALIGEVILPSISMIGAGLTALGLAALLRLAMNIAAHTYPRETLG